MGLFIVVSHESSIAVSHESFIAVSHEPFIPPVSESGFGVFASVVKSFIFVPCANIPDSIEKLFISLEFLREKIKGLPWILGLCLFPSSCRHLG